MSMFTAILTKGRSRSSLNVDAPTQAIATAAVEMVMEPGWEIVDVRPTFLQVRVASEGRPRKLVVQRSEDLGDTWTTVGAL